MFLSICKHFVLKHRFGRRWTAIICFIIVSIGGFVVGAVHSAGIWNVCFRVTFCIYKIIKSCLAKQFWSSWIMDCTCMLLTFGKRVPLMRQGASVVWHPSLPLMNNFNNRGCFFLVQAMLPEGFPFHQFVTFIYDAFHCRCPEKGRADQWLCTYGFYRDRVSMGPRADNDHWNVSNGH